MLHCAAGPPFIPLTLHRWSSGLTPIWGYVGFFETINNSYLTAPKLSVLNEAFILLTVYQGSLSLGWTELTPWWSHSQACGQLEE